MKRKLCLLFFIVLLGCCSLGAQEAVRKELHGIDPRLTAYHFTESGEYLFVLNCSYTVGLGDKSVNANAVLFSGDTVEARRFFDAFSAFIEKNRNNGEAAFRMDSFMIHRVSVKWTNGGYCDLFLPEGECVSRLTDREFTKMYDAFQTYCREQGI